MLQIKWTVRSSEPPSAHPRRSAQQQSPRWRLARRASRTPSGVIICMAQASRGYLMGAREGRARERERESEQASRKLAAQG
jgi:hypothetical protein